LTYCRGGKVANGKKRTERKLRKAANNRKKNMKGGKTERSGRSVKLSLGRSPRSKGVKIYPGQQKPEELSRVLFSGVLKEEPARWKGMRRNVIEKTKKISTP